MKEDKIAETPCKCWRDDKCLQNFCQKNLKRRDHLGRLVVYGRVILNSILNKQELGCELDSSCPE
jgi:hypothetical protein